MKRIIILALSLLVTTNLIGQNIDFSFSYSGWNDEFLSKYPNKICSDNIVYLDDVFLVKAWFDMGKIDKKKIILDQTKRIEKDISNHFIKDKLSDNMYFLEGKGLVLYLNGKINSQSIDYKQYLDDYNNWLKKKSNYYYHKVKNSEPESWLGYIVLHESGVKEISASSVLIENTRIGKTIYAPDNLLTRLYYRCSDEPYYIDYDSLTPPWVEGKDDYGIGEYLDMEFKWPSDEMQILNGFVDFNRMDLYEKNSRVKTVLIESENPKFSKEYQLDDLVRYTLISLPQKTQKIRMTIKDVYPGTKYKDTCLSSILVTNPNVPSYEEMSTKILNAMKNGVIDMRYDKSEPLPDFIKVVEK